MNASPPAAFSPVAGAPRRSVRAAWIALGVAGALGLVLHADALPGLALDAGASVPVYHAAQGIADALAPLNAPRDALADLAASLRPDAM